MSEVSTRQLAGDEPLSGRHYAINMISAQRASLCVCAVITSREPSNSNDAARADTDRVGPDSNELTPPTLCGCVRTTVGCFGPPLVSGLALAVAGPPVRVAGAAVFVCGGVRCLWARRASGNITTRQVSR